MDPRQTLKVVANSGMFTGFGNKVREENRRWWATRKWLVQTGLWLLLINGICSVALMQLRGASTFSFNELVGIFTGLLGWMVAFGVIILTQGDILDEKISGTAEWVLSSPLSREGFILSKLLVNLAWMGAIVVFLQGAVFDAIVTVSKVGSIGWLALSQGLLLQALHLVFWMCLIVMLGVFFKSRGPVIGVPLVFLFFQQFIPMMAGSSASWVGLVLPDKLPEYSTDLLMGGSIPSAIPIVSACVASLLFVVLAILRFNREEFKGA